MKRRGRHLEAVLLLLAVLLVPVACTEGDNGVSEREDMEPAPEFAGRILTTGGFRDPAMGIHDLAADTTERIRLPGDPEVIDASWSAVPMVRQRDWVRPCPAMRTRQISEGHSFWLRFAGETTPRFW